MPPCRRKALRLLEYATTMVLVCGPSVSEPARGNSRLVGEAHEGPDLKLNEIEPYVNEN